MTKKNTRYTRPALTDHKVLYKGRRFWIFEVSDKHPFDGEEQYGDIVIYDCLNDVSMIVGETQSDGSILGFIQYGQGSIDVGGRDAKQFLENAVATWKWLDKQF